MLPSPPFHDLHQGLVVVVESLVNFGGPGDMAFGVGALPGPVCPGADVQQAIFVFG